MSAKEALDRYYGRIAKEQERAMRPPKKNGKPEEAVKLDCLKWLKTNGFDCDVVESKAAYSRAAGRYLPSQTRSGFSDIVGVCPNGLACFIEVKAPGKRSTLKPHQRAFLEAKIALGAFAVCVDSAERLSEVWEEFIYISRVRTQLSGGELIKKWLIKAIG